MNGLGRRAGLDPVFSLCLHIFSPQLQNLLIVRIGIAGSFSQQLLRDAILEHFLPSQELRVAAQHNIGTAASHIGSNGHGAQLAGLGHDAGLMLVVLSIEDIMGDTLLPQQLGQLLRFLNRNSTHQHWLPPVVAVLNLFHDGTELAGGCAVDGIRVILADDRLVGGDLHHIQTVGVPKFFPLGHGCTSHAGQLIVQPEEILESDGGVGLGLISDLDALLGFDGLV